METKARSMRITTRGATGTVEVDGVDLSTGVRGLTVKLGVGQLPKVELDLIVLELDLDSDDTRLIIPEATRAALVALGWTAPEE